MFVDGELESQVIGQCIKARRIPVSCRKLGADDFGMYRSLFEACLEMDENGDSISASGIHKYLKEYNPETTVRLADVAQMVKGVLAEANLEPVVGQLQELSAKRRLDRAIRECREGLKTGQKASDSFEALRTKFERDDVQVEFRPLSDVIKTETIPTLHDLSEGISHKHPTCFEGLNELIGGGLKAGDLTIITAPTGVGKTAMTLQLAKGFAKDGLTGVIHSVEMTDNESSLRLVSQEAETINLNSVQDLSKGQYEALSEYAKSLAKLPIYFDKYRSGRTWEKFLKNMRIAVEALNLQWVLADYMQRIVSERRHGSQVERLECLSNEFSNAVKEEGLIGIEVVQLNKEGNMSNRPKLSNIHGAQMLANDAATVLVIDTKEIEGQPFLDATIYVDKGRNSAKGEVYGKYYAPELRFEFPRSFNSGW